MSSDIAVRIVEYFNQKGTAFSEVHLSPRELEILKLIAQGCLYYKTIASIKRKRVS